MRPLISFQISRGERISERRCLLETQGQSFAGDGIHAPRSVPDQSNISPVHAVQPKHASHRPSFCANNLGARKATMQCRKIANRFLKSLARTVQNQNHADLLRTNGCDIGLPRPCPMDLNEIVPWLQFKMLPESKSNLLGRTRLHAAPAPHSRVASIRTYDPLHADFIPASHQYTISIKPGHCGIPEERHSDIGCLLDQLFVQSFTTDSSPGLVGKIRAHRGPAVLEANSSKGSAIFLLKHDSKFAESRNSIRQQPFAAGFGDRRLQSIRDKHPKSTCA